MDTPKIQALALVRLLHCKTEGRTLQAHFSLSLHFNIISVTDTTITNSDIPLDFDLPIPSYNFEYLPTPLSARGVGMYIDNGFTYIVVERT